MPRFMDADEVKNIIHGRLEDNRNLRDRFRQIGDMRQADMFGDRAQALYDLLQEFNELEIYN